MAAPRWETGQGPVPLGEPVFLGILNATPDSFSDGGRYQDPVAALAQARFLAGRGVRMLDLGAESTRPGAAAVAPQEEWARLEPLIRLLRAELPHLPLSLDTRNAEVAARGLRAGAAVINDVTGFRDPALLAAVREAGCGLIAMRSRMAGRDFVMPAYDTPQDAAQAATEALAELAGVRDRLLGEGIDPARILLDPGFGFGFPYSGDLAIWQSLPEWPKALDWPVERFCIGVSRKRFLARRAGSPALPASGRDGLTAEAHREALGWGFRVFRTHAGMLNEVNKLPDHI
jgi:dihydropteroate synthase